MWIGDTELNSLVQGVCILYQSIIRTYNAYGTLTKKTNKRHNNRENKRITAILKGPALSNEKQAKAEYISAGQTDKKAAR